jgi:methionyl-tRNA synthetase
MAKRRFLVTGALPYSNGRLHVGHIAGAYLPSDIYVRYLRARGDDVCYICGSDDNGVAALKAAREDHLTPEALTAKYNASQQQSFDGLGIRFDIYGGTHQPGFTEIHEKLCQEFFLRIHEKGLFTKRATEQLYDEQENQFLPDKYVQGTCPYPDCGSHHAFGDQCEGCGRPMDATSLIDPVSALSGTKPVPRRTVHWFMRLDQLQSALAEWLRSKRDPAQAGAHWRPNVINQSLGRIESEGLPERAMTRDLTWGVPVPLDDPDAAGKALYVWFDAPIGYVSFTAKYLADASGGGQGYARWWKDPDCKIVHFIGEDNIVFHAITWPAMLLATHGSDSTQGQPGEYQLPHNVVANAFLNIQFPGKDEEKVSKSRGTAIWIEEYLKAFDPDPLRYYLTANAPEQARTTFVLEDFVNRNNNELLAALGNFVNRTVTFTHKYFEGRVPEPGQREAIDRQQLDACRAAAAATADELEAVRFKSALGKVMDLARAGNGYFDATAPFRTRKTDMAACGRAINVCLQTVRTLTTIMAPFLPFSADRAATMLRLDRAALAWDRGLEELAPGRTLDEPALLYKKLDPIESIGH